MSTTRIRGAVAALAAGALVSTGALAGCSITRDDEPAQQPAVTSPEPSPDETTEPAPDPSAPSSSAPASPAEPASPPANSDGSPEQALLTAPEMPQLNDTSAWSETSTAPAGSGEFGLCQKFDLLTIGATSAVERIFSNPAGDSAGQQVADFPDSQNAVRARKVVESWHRDCASRVQGKRVNVDPIAAVSVASGTGWHYLVSYRRNGTGRFHALGLVVDGTRLTLIRMDHDGQDHNYDSGEDPMERAVLAAAAKLG